MKRFKGFIATLLIGSMLVSVAGCSAGSRFSSKKLAEYAEDFGAEVYDDADDFNDDINNAVINDDLGDLEDGMVITTDEDVKDILRDGILHEATEFVYSKDITQTTVFVDSLGTSDVSDDALAIICAMDYDSAKEAQDAYEDMVEDLEDNLDVLEEQYADTDSETGNDNGVEYMIASAEMNRFVRVYGIYLSGSSVMFICGAAEQPDNIEDVLDDICEDLNIVSPNEV